MAAQIASLVELKSLAQIVLLAEFLNEKHESPRTTKLYDRTGDEITLVEVEPITI